MSQVESNDREELELLAGLVLGDLNTEEHERAESILASNESSNTILEDLERTAAGVQLALWRDRGDLLPDSLAERIRQDGRRIVGVHEPNAQESSANPPTATDAEPAIDLADRGSSVNRRELFAWFCAAAALLIAVTIWRGASTTAKSASIARSELISATPSILKVDWTSGKTPFDEPVSGDVVWDSKTQSGFMRFENMPVNDPTVEQYQLWIIDPERDDEPIDGGVFDITESGEVIVEIDAKLKVLSPAAFAITIEKPGGVVVSTQERLPLLAAVE